ncbi:ATP-dependent DNA helicase [[Pseudopropionibacterium] massiliense]|uniref:ATP-dependent DNA helicase n=1 Tax=[Pseudopropionibacterium] massiliense TaxID=2220000 RepID=UPI0010322D1A|nr:ATP-dependent DNA helicase [[Pseudopropionibacterium] massiliense]
MNDARTWRLLPTALPDVPVPDVGQEKAAMPFQGVRVVLGGPGTGKTTTMAAAVVKRLESGSTLERLVVLTASRQAAQELRRDIIRRRGGAEVGARVTTVHGFALGLLRELGDFEQDLRLLRAPEQEQRLRDLLEGEGDRSWPEEVRAAARTRTFARQLREVLSRARQLGLDPENIIQLASGDPLFEAVGNFFETYLTIADFDGALDYTELVHRARLLLADDAVAEACRSRFDAVLVDDAQELDQVAANLLADLARIGFPLLVLGDPQQRLGSFRGASAAGITLLRRLPGAETLELVTGHRNRPAVAEALAGIRERLNASDAPPAASPAQGEGSLVTVSIYDDSAAETAHLAAALREAVAVDGCAWHELAVIARSGRTQLAPLARELTARGIPVDVAGDELALGSQHAVENLLAGLTAAANLEHLGAETVTRLLAGPLCELDAVGQRALSRFLLTAGIGDPDSRGLLGKCLGRPELLEALPGPEAERVRALGILLGRAAEELTRGAPVVEVLWMIWSGTGWPERLREAALAGSRGANQDLDAVVELFELAGRRQELAGHHGADAFCSAVMREEIPADTGRELSTRGRGVRLLTAHRSRSGSWRRVHVIGASEGTWPQTGWRGLLLDPDRLAPDHLDAVSTADRLASERRSFYVACSRAAEQLHVSAPAASEAEPAEPSRFCRELGVTPVRVVGLPEQRQTAASLIAELRQVVSDTAESPAMRRAAALRLAHLGDITDQQFRPAFRDARPENWWGVREPSSPAWRTSRPLVITGSTLQALLTCPRQWFLSRRGGADRPRGPQAGVGDVIHRVAQRAAWGTMGLEEMIQDLDEVWPRLRFEARWMETAEKEQMRRALTRFHAWNETNPDELLGVEVNFETPIIVKDVPVLLRGTVDRLELRNGKLSVVDLKTGRRPPTRTEVAEHTQLGVYQLAARLGAFDSLAPGIREVAEPSLLQLRHGGALPERQFQPVLPEGPSWLTEKLEQAVEILLRETFEAREGPQCAWCAFGASCPAINPGGME